MKKNIIILVIVFILTACKMEKELTGTWIGIGAHFTKLNYYHCFLDVMTFSGLDYTLSSYNLDKKYDGHYNRRTNRFSSDFYNNNKEVYDETIHFLNSDSLVIKTIDENNDEVEDSSRLIYKRLNDSLKFNFPFERYLSGNKFELKTGVSSDTIYFKNDSVLIKNSLLQNPNQDSKKSLGWQSINENGFELLFISGDYSYVIYDKKGSIYFLKSFGPKIVDYKLIELE